MKATVIGIVLLCALLLVFVGCKKTIEGDPWPTYQPDLHFYLAEDTVFVSSCIIGGMVIEGYVEYRDSSANHPMAGQRIYLSLSPGQGYISPDSNNSGSITDTLGRVNFRYFTWGTPGTDTIFARIPIGTGYSAQSVESSGLAKQTITIMPATELLDLRVSVEQDTLYTTALVSDSLVVTISLQDTLNHRSIADYPLHYHASGGWLGNWPRTDQDGHAQITWHSNQQFGQIWIRATGCMQADSASVVVIDSTH